MFRVNLLKGFVYPLSSLKRLFAAWLIMPISLLVLVPPILFGLGTLGLVRMSIAQGLGLTAGIAVVCIIVGAIPFTFLTGYLLRCRKRVIEGDSQLPPWNRLGQMFADGSQMDTLACIIALPAFALFGGGVLSVGAGIGNLTANASWGAALFALLSSGAGLLFLLGALFFYLMVLIFSPIATLRLAMGHSPWGALALGGMLGDIRRGFFDYVLCGLAVWSISIIFSLAQAACWPLVVVSFPVQVYLQLVWANLLGQYARVHLAR